MQAREVHGREEREEEKPNGQLLAEELRRRRTGQPVDIRRSRSAEATPTLDSNP